MPRPNRPTSDVLPTSGTKAGPTLVPCILLRRGKVCLPGPTGPIEARAPSGEGYDPFDVVDRLAEEYSLLYIVDLDGIERGEPQLDYLQELSRDVGIWVDGGVRKADQAIDILVAGARRAVLSSALLASPRELKRAWRLSPELAFEVELAPNRQAIAQPAWETTDPERLAEVARDVGVQEIVLSPRGEDPDWALVHRVAVGGPTWVDGAFSTVDAPRLTEAGAVGGIFHIDLFLAGWSQSSTGTASSTGPSRDAR